MVTNNTLSHVLYVDDDPNMRMLVQMALENAGNMRVVLCESALELLEDALDDIPQLVILDALMPGMDGPAILKAMRDDPRLSAIPVVFLTGRAKPEDVEAFKAMGAIGVIAKPFDIVTLSDQVRKLWETCQ